MRIVTHQSLAKRNRQIASWLMLITFGLLIGAFVLVNYSIFTGQELAPWLLILQGLTIPLAYLLTVISIRMQNHWARKPFPETIIPQGLKGVSKKSVLYNYYHFPARHVLIAPQGIFAITTRWHDGTFTVTDGTWKSHKGLFSRLSSALRMDHIGHPNREAQRASQHVAALLQEIAPDVDVRPLIVLTNEQIDVDIQSSDIDIVYITEKKSPNLSDYMRQLNREQKDHLQQKAVLPLTAEQIAQFEAQTIPTTT